MYFRNLEMLLVCASSSLDSSMRIWDLEKGEKIAMMDCGPVDLWTVVFSPDDKYIISGSHAGKITVFNVETARADQFLDTTRGTFTLSIDYVSFYCIVTKAIKTLPFIESRWEIHCEWWY